MAERFDYPTAGAPTTSFVPSIDGWFDSSGETLKHRILRKQSIGEREYRYEQGLSTREITRGYRLMPAADKTNFIAFVNAALGATFEFTDYAAVVHVVAFANFDFPFKPREGIFWDFDVTMREEL
jgi:hypothetical protein